MATVAQVISILGLTGTQDTWLINWIGRLCGSQAPADVIAAWVRLRLAYLELANSVAPDGIALSEEKWKPWIRRLAMGENPEALATEIRAICAKTQVKLSETPALRKFWVDFCAAMSRLAINGLATTPENMARIIECLAGGGDPQRIVDFMIQDKLTVSASATP